MNSCSECLSLLMLRVISINYNNNNNVIHYSPKMRYSLLSIAIYISIEPIVLDYFLNHVLLFLKPTFILHKERITYFYSFSKKFLVTLCSMWDLSSLSRD